MKIHFIFPVLLLPISASACLRPQATKLVPQTTTSLAQNQVVDTMPLRASPRETRPKSGFIARAGSSVGATEIADYSWTTLGGHIALGYHLGPFALEFEYERSSLKARTDLGTEHRGDTRRLGANLRYYFMSVLSQKNSDVLLFVELSSGRQSGILEEVSFSRRDQGTGFGFSFDHRTNWNGLSSIGWHLGWRFVVSKRAPEATARIICKKTCPKLDSDTSDLSSTLNSSLSIRW